MKVFHVESGLGNQMLDYVDLIASRYVNPKEEYYIETIIYELGDNQKSISMWNGYELDKIFGINENNVRSFFDDSQWNTIIGDVINSQFWDDGWTYSDAIADAFEKQGLKLDNIHRRPHTGQKVADQEFSLPKYILKSIYYRVFSQKASARMSVKDKLFRKSDADEYNGHYLRFLYKGNDIELIHDEILKAFVFPEYDEKNNEFAKELRECNSVAIHARRGDFLGQNSYCYKYGYFKRAVSYIKKKVKSPKFYIFCDPGSVEWCKENAKIFGLDYSKDSVTFVDWNLGNESYRDMQLMAECKHNIITNSSFGWWGAYLNRNPDKITCSPDARINTTHWF